MLLVPLMPFVKFVVLMPFVLLGFWLCPLGRAFGFLVVCFLYLCDALLICFLSILFKSSWVRERFRIELYLDCRGRGTNFYELFNLCIFDST